MQYDAKSAQVPVSLTHDELKALREAAQQLGYNLPGLTSAGNKLRAALKGAGA